MGRFQHSRERGSCVPSGNDFAPAWGHLGTVQVTGEDVPGGRDVAEELAHSSIGHLLVMMVERFS